MVACNWTIFKISWFKLQMFKKMLLWVINIQVGLLSIGKFLNLIILMGKYYNYVASDWEIFKFCCLHLENIAILLLQVGRSSSIIACNIGKRSSFFLLIGKRWKMLMFLTVNFLNMNFLISRIWNRFN